LVAATQILDGHRVARKFVLTRNHREPDAGAVGVLQLLAQLAALQRDLGGAIMQSIFGALLAAGYAASFTAAIAASPNSQKVSDSVEAQLTKSFAGAEAVAQQYPKYADQITAAAKASFLSGDQWAYSAGIVAVLLGAALVFFMFPRKDDEERLLAEYHATDTAGVKAGS